MAFKPNRGQLAVPAGSTATITGPDVVNSHGHRGLVAVVVTTVIGTGSITLTIQGKDSASATYYTLLAGVAIVTNTTNRYTVYPGLTAAANVTVSDVLPEIFRPVVTANNANRRRTRAGGRRFPEGLARGRPRVRTLRARPVLLLGPAGLRAQASSGQEYQAVRQQNAASRGG